MFTVENISTLTSLVIAVVSLLISLVALRVSRKTYIFSSKDYPPDIRYTIDRNDKLTVLHKSNDLFAIDAIHYLKIRTVGYEDRANKLIIQASFVMNSLTWRWIKREGRAKKTIINPDAGGPCAYICPYDHTMVEKLQAEFDKSLYSKVESGYALPSLQSQYYIVEVIYTDAFQERKTAIYVQQHVHGHGYDKIKISEEALRARLSDVNIPKFSTQDELLHYVRKNRSTPFEKFFGR